MERSFAVKDARQIAFEFFHGTNGSFSFQPSLTLFFGLRGTVSILCGTEEWKLTPAGLFTINPFELFRIVCSDDAAAIALYIPRELLRMAGWSDEIQCRCFAGGAETISEYFDEIRGVYASIFQNFFQDKEQNAAQIASDTIRLAGILLSQFSTRREEPVKNQQKQEMLRLKRILDTIHDHWNEKLSLAEIAKQEYLSISYLSRFFKNSLHTTFTGYLTELRLNRAAQMLISSKDSVTQIAYACGFRSGSAFINYFRERYGQTPGQYRIKQENTEQETTLRQIDISESVAVLLSYTLPEKEKPKTVYKTQSVFIRCDSPGIPLRNTWRRLCNIGYAHDGLLADVRRQLERIQREIGFEYLRFHGLFDEDMKIYMECPDGAPYYNFTYTDLLFDYILSLRMKPYVELSFLPTQLATKQNRIFDRPTIISACNDLGKWAALVRAVLLHFVERYGREIVREWRFTTISMNYAFLGCMTIDEYFDLYRATWRAVKETDKNFLFGGPGGFANLVWEPNGYPKFLTFATEQGCMPDFFAVQYYPHRAAGRDPAFMDFTTSQQSVPTVLSGDESFMLTVRKKLEKLFTEYGVQERELWFEECNSTLWQRDLSSDTCYKAVWLVKNLCENYDRAEAFGYWLLTDLMDEHTALENVFHGGYGLFTYNGVPKSGYHAMRFLRQLGDTLVDSGDGWFLTRRGKDFQLLLYNYCHYDNLYRYRYKRLEIPQDAYSVFQRGAVRLMRLSIENLPDGLYRLESRSIRRECGSSFDKWLEIGAPQYLRPDELLYLSETSRPAYHVREVSVKNGLQMEETLYPLETRLLLLHHLEI